MKPNVATETTNSPKAEMERLHADDLHAARIVVGLITGVFVTGLLLYAFILLVVLF